MANITNFNHCCSVIAVPSEFLFGLCRRDANEFLRETGRREVYRYIMKCHVSRSVAGHQLAAAAAEPPTVSVHTFPARTTNNSNNRQQL